MQVIFLMIPHATTLIVACSVLNPTLVCLLVSFGMEHVNQAYNDNFLNLCRIKRHFLMSWYYKFLRNGTKMERSWLVYPLNKCKISCHCCWLFAVILSSSYSLNWCDVSDGIRNFRKGTEKIEKHKASAMYLQARKC